MSRQAALSPLALLLCPAFASATVTFYESLTALQAAAPTTVPVTFDPFSPVGQTLAPDLTLGGIDIHAIDSSPSDPNLFIAPPSQANFGIPRDSNVLTASGNEHFLFTFHTPRQAAGFDLYTNDADAPTLFVYSPAGALLGQHATTQVPNTAGFLGFLADTAVGKVEYLASNGQFTNTGIDNIRASLPGDANLDGRIDSDDFALLDRGAARGLAGYANGDFDGDGAVNAADRAILYASLASQGGNPAALAVPEPVLVLPVAATALVRRRPRASP